MPWPSLKTSMPAPRRPPNALLKAEGSRARESVAGDPPSHDGGYDLHGTLSGHIAVQAGYEAPLALLLGDAVNALILNDDKRGAILAR